MDWEPILKTSLPRYSIRILQTSYSSRRLAKTRWPMSPTAKIFKTVSTMMMLILITTTCPSGACNLDAYRTTTFPSMELRASFPLSSSSHSTISYCWCRRGTTMSELPNTAKLRVTELTGRFSINLSRYQCCYFRRLNCRHWQQNNGAFKLLSWRITQEDDYYIRSMLSNH